MSKRLVVGLMAVLLIAIVGSATAQTFEIGDYNIAVGGTATIPVEIKGVTDLGAATIEIHYDPSVINVTSVDKGNLGGTLVSNVNNTAGIVRLVWYTVTGKTGDFTFAKLNVSAVNEGTTELGIVVETCADSNGNPIPTSVNNGTVIVIINITTIKVEVEPKEVTWGTYNNVTIRVTTSEGYPVAGANVTLVGVNTGFEYGTSTTDEGGRATFTILPSLDDSRIEVVAKYWNGTEWLSDTDYIEIRPPLNITYVYGYARIENTQVPKPLANVENVSIYVAFSPSRPSTPYCVRNTTKNGEFVFAVETPRDARKLYIWIETGNQTLGKEGYVTARYNTTYYPGYVPIEPGTTSVQANVPVRAEIYVVYPEYIVVQVYNDLDDIWSNNRTCCKECIDTPPKKADGVSKFKVKATLYVNGREYNLTDLENALAQLGINALPDYVRVCVNDTNIAVMDTNGQMCDNITFTYKHNSTAIFYVRSNAPTDPSELKPENTGIVNITGWYNYKIDRNVIPVNVPRVSEVSLTDYDCADFEGTGYIAGEVVDSQTKHSIAGAKVYVKWFNGTAWVNATDFKGNQIVTTSDEHGHYKLEVISGRTYKVYAEKEGYKGCAPSQEVYVQLGTTTTADVVLVKNSITKPDLTVESIDVAGTPVVNETVTVKAKIANVGEGDAGAFNVRLYADGSPVDTKTVESLAAGNSTTVEFSWTPDKAKIYVLKVVVDTDNAVKESNENNNEKTESVTVKSVTGAGINETIGKYYPGGNANSKNDVLQAIINAINNYFSAPSDKKTEILNDIIAMINHYFTLS